MTLDKEVSYTLKLNEQDHMKLMVIFNLAKEAITFAERFPDRESAINSAVYGTEFRTTAQGWLDEFLDLFESD